MLPIQPVPLCDRGKIHLLGLSVRLLLHVEGLLENEKPDGRDQADDGHDEVHSFRTSEVAQFAGVDLVDHAIRAEVGQQEAGNRAGHQLRSGMGETCDPQEGALTALGGEGAHVAHELRTPDGLPHCEHDDLAVDEGEVGAGHVHVHDAGDPLRRDGEDHHRESTDHHPREQHPVDVELLHHGGEKDQAHDDDDGVDGAESADVQISTDDAGPVLGVHHEHQHERDVGRDGQSENAKDFVEGLVAKDFAQHLRDGLLLGLLLDGSSLFPELRELIFTLDEEVDDEPADHCQAGHVPQHVGISTSLAEGRHSLGGRAIERTTNVVDQEEERSSDVHAQVPEVERGVLSLLVAEPLGPCGQDGEHESVPDHRDQVEDEDCDLSEDVHAENEGGRADAQEPDRDDRAGDQGGLAEAEPVQDGSHEDLQDRGAGHEHADHETCSLVAEPHVLGEVQRVDGNEGEVHQAVHQVESLDAPELPRESEKLPELSEVALQGFQQELHGHTSFPFGSFYSLLLAMRVESYFEKRLLSRPKTHCFSDCQGVFFSTGLFRC